MAANSAASVPVLPCPMDEQKRRHLNLQPLHKQAAMQGIPGSSHQQHGSRSAHLANQFSCIAPVPVSQDQGPASEWFQVLRNVSDSDEQFLQYDHLKTWKCQDNPAA